MKSTIVFIDAGYLSFISKFFGEGKPLKYKIEVFANNLAKAKGLKCEKIYFYTAPPYQSSKPTPEENKRKASYDKFILKLKEDKINVILAYFTDKKRKSGLSLSNHLWKASKDKIKIRKEYFLNK